MFKKLHVPPRSIALMASLAVVSCSSSGYQGSYEGTLRVLESPMGIDSNRMATLVIREEMGALRAVLGDGSLGCTVDLATSGDAGLALVSAAMCPLNGSNVAVTGSVVLTTTGITLSMQGNYQNMQDGSLRSVQWTFSGRRR